MAIKGACKSYGRIDCELENDNTAWIDLLTTDRKLYRQGILLLVGSALFLSTSGIALRSIEQANGWQILFYRSVALSITVFLFLAYQKRSAVLDEFRGLGWNDAMLAVFLGTGMVAYVFALLYITVANALFILSSTPFVAGILGWIVLRERVAAGPGLPLQCRLLDSSSWLAAVLPVDIFWAT